MSLHHRIALLTTISVMCGTAWAQRLLGPDPATTRPGVFVRDSAVASEKLALAQRMERLKEWNKSADVYQEIVEKYADRVVPARSEGSAQRYTSVLLAVQELLGRWPAEGLQVYRARYETPAATMLEGVSGDDIAALNRVVQLYFPTDAAKNAAMRLIELYLENGEFTAAAWLGERLLTNHPGIEADRAQVLFCTALALHMSGNTDAARAKLDEIKKTHADNTGVVRGRDVVLADELAALLQAPVPQAHGTAADSWPIFGGDASRGRVPDAHGRTGAKIAEVVYPRLRQRPLVDRQQMRILNEAERERRNSGLALGIIPSIDRGELFYQDNTRVYAVSIDSGLALPAWEITYGSDKARFTDSAILGTNTQMTVTLTDNAVLAILGQSNRAEPMDQPRVLVFAPPELVCLDRATGAKKWKTSSRDLPESLRELELSGSPLVVGENVYVAARGGKPMQFSDAYVLCFALADGKLRWACYLASGNAPGQNFNNFPQQADAVSHLAYAGGCVYACTNLGAVAAIDAYAGTIAWLTLYPKPQQNMNQFLAMQLRSGDAMPSPRKPWAQNPVIVKDGFVFALPSDAEHLFIYRAADGQERTRIAMSDFQNADTLLGVLGDKLIVSSANRVYCINWPQYDPKRPPTQNVHWYGLASGPGTEPENQDAVRGRGFVTRDAVFIPTRWGLKRIELKNGSIGESYPSDGSWPAGEGPGNVLVTQDQVIIAGMDSINVYSDLALARAKLDRAEEAAPKDPMPRLKYAETLFAAGQIEPAVQKLDEAIALLGGLRNQRPGAARDRAFARALTFAERAAEPKIGAADVALAASLYERAAAAAQSPAQHVAYRLSHARFARAQRDFIAEVRLYQEILLEPAYRGVAIPAEDGSAPAQAGAIAEARIGERVRDFPAAYAPFEQAAEQALSAAKQSNDPQRMLAVAQMYPNARVAPQAMLAAADVFEAGGRHRPAAQVLNQLDRKYRETPDRARIIEAQARNYLALPGGVGVAIGRLMEGAKLPGVPRLTQPLKLPDGNTIENVTFGAAAELLQKYSSRLATASLPDLKLPMMAGPRTEVFLPEDPQTVIAEVDQLVVPPRELRALARNDRVVTWTEGQGISIYAVGANTPLGTNSTIAQPPRGCAWIGSELLVWSDETIALLKGDDAGALWSAALKSLPPVDALAADVEVAGAEPARQGVVIHPGQIMVDGPARIIVQPGRRIVVGGGGIRVAAAPPAPAPPPADGNERIQHVRAAADRVVVATSAGRVAALELSNGSVAWQSRATESALTHFVSTDDFVAFRYLDQLGTQVVALETYGGNVVARKAFANDGGQIPQNLALSPDGTLLYTLPDRLCGIDLYEPAKGLKFGDAAIGGGNQVFSGMSYPEQLLVAEGRVLAVSDSGQFVRVLSLEDGRESNNPLSTGATNPNVFMRLVGHRLYVISQRSVSGYNLDRPEENWPGTIESRLSPFVREAFVGKHHLVLLDQPYPLNEQPPAADQAAPHFRLLAYARYPKSPGHSAESGKLEHAEPVTNQAGIDQWQAVEGGFYYRSLDRKARFLRGAGDAK